jgi:hypothetical protein
VGVQGVDAPLQPHRDADNPSVRTALAANRLGQRVTGIEVLCVRERWLAGGCGSAAR